MQTNDLLAWTANSFIGWHKNCIKNSIRIRQLKFFTDEEESRNQTRKKKKKQVEFQNLQ